MLTEAISPTVIRENRWEVFTTALMGKGFMPSNHSFHYNYICTLIKRAHHNANNTPDVLYIIYIKANQCSYCVQSTVHVQYMSLFFRCWWHVQSSTGRDGFLFTKHNDDFVAFIGFCERLYYSNHISSIFFLKYIFADTLLNILIAFLSLRAAMLCA